MKGHSDLEYALGAVSEIPCVRFASSGVKRNVFCLYILIQSSEFSKFQALGHVIMFILCMRYCVPISMYILHI